MTSLDSLADELSDATSEQRSLAELAALVDGRYTTDAVEVTLPASLGTDDTGFRWVTEPQSPAGSPVATMPDAASLVVLGDPERRRYTEQYAATVEQALPSVEHVVSVSLLQSATDHVETWQATTESFPEHLHVLSVDNAPTDSRVATTADYSVTIDRLTDPGDLTRLGITLSQTLSSLEPGRTLLTVFSVSALFQYSGPERLFRFLHLLQGKTDSLNAVGHYHMNPAEHDEQTVRTFRGLFDATVVFENDRFRPVSDQD